MRGIRVFGQSYASMADALGSLAAHSERQAQIEDKTGTSCGSRAGVGKGSRYNLRMIDRATFSAFDADVAKRVADLQALISQAETITAASATEAMAKLPELRRIVDQAKVFEADPLLQNLKTAAEQRILAGKAPMAGTAGSRRKGESLTFSCPDPALDRLLKVVDDAVTGIKPVPEITTIDSRDPRVGFARALRRLVVSVVGSSFWPPSREELIDGRRRQLAGTAAATDGIQSNDVPPLAVAAIIEALLTILFWCAWGQRSRPSRRRGLAGAG